MELDHAVYGDFRELSGEEAWETIENFIQGHKRREKPLDTISEHEKERLKFHAKRLFGDESMWFEWRKEIEWDIKMFREPTPPVGDLNIMEDKVENLSALDSPQTPPSLDVYTPPTTYPEELDETLGILMEIEPLGPTKLEHIGLNTHRRELSLSYRGFPSDDEPEPQLFFNLSPLDENLGYKRGTDPFFYPSIPESFRMKVVEPLTTHTPPSPHVAYYCLNGVYRYYHPHLTLSVGRTHFLRVK